MLYSFAMATSFVWGVALGPIFADPARFPYLVEVNRWGDPLVHLGAAKWWLDRTARPDAKVVPLRTAERPDIDRRAA